MDPLMISAQFAAYTWFAECHADRSNSEAMHFARKNWPSFLELAPEGLGQLLIRIGRLCNTERRRHRPARRRTGRACLGAAG
jgi:hypothetical protein